MKRVIISIFIFISSLFVISEANAQSDQEKYSDINKNIEIFNSVVKQLDLFYVDTLNIEKNIKAGISGMLAGLDPYTEYISQNEMDNFKFITTGEYAGIGSYITARKIDGEYRVMISGPYEGMPAAKAGLKEGDIILAVDGIDMTRIEDSDNTGSNNYGNNLSNQVSTKLKGQPGTEVKIKVQRPGKKNPLDFTIKREQIQVSSVPYYGLLGNNTGYISFTGFTDKSSQDVKHALLDLKNQGATSLILDLRGNGGGIMEEAVQIVNFFDPNGEVVLSTTGKLRQSDRVYNTTLAPIDTEIPLAVLVDRGSASASEIVAGALQDMDRAVIIGERTFGKGLVQMARDLPYGGSVKITTSKYYIPSGRSIQAIDYTHRNEDGSVGRIPDSLTTVYKTVAGREVRDGGGIVPDITIKEQKIPSIVYYLASQYIIFDFVTDWTNSHSKIAPVESFKISNQDYEDFKKFVKEKNDFKYDMLSEKTLNSLKEIMEFEGYMNTAGEEFKALESKLVPDIDRDLESFRDDIEQLISMEIVKRYYYRKGEIIEELKSSKEIKEAVKVLGSPQLYKDVLSEGYIPKDYNKQEKAV